MAYIGKQPVVGNFVKLDAIVTSATATYNLLNGGVAYFPQTANNCIVSLNGVIQSPTSAYTISGSTIVFDSALTSSDSIDFILVLGDVLAIGTPSDGTVTSAKLASGTAGLIAWQSVQTTGFTASAGRGYPCNTTSSAFTVTLPASPSVGDTIILLDYAGTFGTNNLTLGRNSNKIHGEAYDYKLKTNGITTAFVYVDATQGWVLKDSGLRSESATTAPYSVDFLVIAGGGGGGGTGGGTGWSAGGGGAGGYRNSYSTETSGGGGSSESSLTFNVGTVYTITVGSGGAGGLANSSGANTLGTNGVDSSISGTGLTTITSTGGGGGASDGGAKAGGSGGGASYAHGSGLGTANQGFLGGGTGASTGNGGGGAGEAGGTDGQKEGGDGLSSSITGSSVARAGGGGAGASTPGNGGDGGGGNGSNTGTPGNGTTNTGSGGGGGNTLNAGGSGGKGVVILRIPTANYSGTTTGSPTVTTDGSDKVIVFNDSGSITG